jgi:hypothetical protein
MAVVKLKYIPRGKEARAEAKATLGYNARRPGQEAEQVERKLFGHGGVLTPEQTDRMIDEAPNNTYFWKLIISPDPKSENPDKNLDLRQLTTEMIEWLEARLDREIPFIGAEHDDHTGIPHIHAIALIERRGREMLIDRETLNAFREFTTEKALSQKQERERPRTLTVSPVSKQGSFQKNKYARHLTGEGEKHTKRLTHRVKMKTHACSNCGAREGMIKLRSGALWCRSCEYVQEIDLGESMDLSL